jgi:hypothetical protein
VGVAPGEAVVRGSVESGSFGAFYLDGSRVVGAVSVDGGVDLDEARRLIRSRAAVPRQALADERGDLSAL